MCGVAFCEFKCFENRIGRRRCVVDRFAEHHRRCCGGRIRGFASGVFLVGAAIFGRLLFEERDRFEDGRCEKCCEGSRGLFKDILRNGFGCFREPSGEELAAFRRVRGSVTFEDLISPVGEHILLSIEFKRKAIAIVLERRINRTLLIESIVVESALFLLLIIDAIII